MDQHYVRYVRPKCEAGYTMKGEQNYGNVQKTWQDIKPEKSITQKPGNNALKQRSYHNY